MSARSNANMAAPLGRMQERTRQAREGMAEKLFSRAALESAMSDASAAGHSVARIEPEKPVDLYETAAAKAAAAWLAEQGFRVKWDRKARPELGQEWRVLVIEW